MVPDSPKVIASGAKGQYFKSAQCFCFDDRF